MQAFVCFICNRTYTAKRLLSQHYKEKHHARVKLETFKCTICELSYYGKVAFQKHSEQHVNKTRFTCYRCNKGFRLKEDRDTHLNSCAPPPQRGDGILPSTSRYASTPSINVHNNFTVFESAFSGNILAMHRQFEYTDKIEHVKLCMENELYELLRGKMKDSNFKFSLVLHVVFYKAANPDESTDPPIKFHSETHTVYSADSLELLRDKISLSYNNFLINIDVFNQNGSGYVLENFVKLDILLAKHDPTRAGSYIELPKELKNPMKGLVNIKNKYDSKCFLWSVLAGLNMDTNVANVTRLSNYEHRESEINMSGLVF